MMFEGFWPTLFAGLCGALIGAIATIASALISRKPSLATVVDTRIRMLIDAYERTIAELRGEIGKLEVKVDIYEKTIRDLRNCVAQLEAKVDDLNRDLRNSSAYAFREI